MPPASRSAPARRLASAAPLRGVRTWMIVGLLAAAGLLAFYLSRDPDRPGVAVRVDVPSAPVLDPVLALPFGEGRANPLAPAESTGNGAVEALRTAYRNSDDWQALYRQWRDRPEPDARYLAFRAARDCELLRAGGVTAELEARSERRGERERQMAAATQRCRGFLREPAPPDEVQRLELDAATAGHPAARIARATESFARQPLAETIEVVRSGLASGDPLAFDEARVLLALSRHQVEVAGVAPTPSGDVRTTDARVVAIDLVGCRLGNPCGPSRAVIGIDCGANGPCLREAEEWVVQSADLDADERRAASALAERMLAAFKRGAIDEIVRLPAAAPRQ